jgi:hypothetical protein
MKLLGSSLFAFLVIAVLAAGIPLIFFVNTFTGERIVNIQNIINWQQIIISNITSQQNETVIILEDLGILTIIITQEQLDVIDISNEITRINCIGVKQINGVFPEPVNRTFTVYGDEGFEIIPINPDTISINASGLESRYQQEQQSISTLYDMAMATQLAIMTLDGQVVKSVNFYDGQGTHNINISGTCGTSVYVSSNSTITVDMCELQANATDAFDGIGFDLTGVIAILDILLIDIQVVVNNTIIVLNEAEALFEAAIFTLNQNATTINNNINILGGLGISVANGTSTNEVTLTNTGIVDMNGLTETNINITAGDGIIITEDAASSTITVTNEYATVPCTVGAVAFSIAQPFFGNTAGTWTALPQPWLGQEVYPPGCTSVVIFRNVPSIVTVGIFTMPEGVWRLSATILFSFRQGTFSQMSLALRPASGAIIPFTSIAYLEGAPFTLTWMYQFYHLEITLNSLLYGVGTPYQLMYNVLGGNPTISTMWYCEYNMTRIS